MIKYRYMLWIIWSYEWCEGYEKFIWDLIEKISLKLKKNPLNEFSHFLPPKSKCFIIQHFILIPTSSFMFQFISSLNFVCINFPPTPPFNVKPPIDIIELNRRNKFDTCPIKVSGFQCEMTWWMISYVKSLLTFLKLLA